MINRLYYSELYDALYIYYPAFGLFSDGSIMIDEDYAMFAAINELELVDFIYGGL